MTVAQRKAKLQRHIARLNGTELAKVEEAVFGLEPDDADLSADDRRKIARMKRAAEQAMKDYAAGRTRNWREIRDDV